MFPDVHPCRTGDSAIAVPVYIAGHGGAQAGLVRARNLDTVLSLTDQGFAYEKDLELEAARQSFESAVELDSEWGPAQLGLDRVLETINQMEFDQRIQW